MNRPLKPVERVAYTASALTFLAAMTPTLVKTWNLPGQDRVLGLPDHFFSAALLALIGLALFVSVIVWIKRTPG